jgi:hypothetical protein
MITTVPAEADRHGARTVITSVSGRQQGNPPLKVVQKTKQNGKKSENESVKRNS